MYVYDVIITGEQLVWKRATQSEETFSTWCESS